MKCLDSCSSLLLVLAAKGPLGRRIRISVQIGNIHCKIYNVTNEMIVNTRFKSKDLEATHQSETSARALMYSRARRGAEREWQAMSWFQKGIYLQMQQRCDNDYHATCRAEDSSSLDVQFMHGGCGDETGVE